MTAGWDSGQDFIFQDGRTTVSGVSNAIAVARGNSYTVMVTAPGNPTANSVLLSKISWNSGHFCSDLCQPDHGRVYALEYRDHLKDAHWSFLGLSAGNGSILQLTDPTANVPQRFYRATRW